MDLTENRMQIETYTESSLTKFRCDQIYSYLKVFSTASGWQTSISTGHLADIKMSNLFSFYLVEG